MQIGLFWIWRWVRTENESILDVCSLRVNQVSAPGCLSRCKMAIHFTTWGRWTKFHAQKGTRWRLFFFFVVIHFSFWIFKFEEMYCSSFFRVFVIEGFWWKFLKSSVKRLQVLNFTLQSTPLSFTFQDTIYTLHSTTLDLIAKLQLNLTKS